MRAFRLVRDADITGISGTGVVAEGVEFSDGTVSLRWTSAWPTSVVFHDRGIESVQAIHGHNGATRIVYEGDDLVEQVEALADAEARQRPDAYSQGSLKALREVLAILKGER